MNWKKSTKCDSGTCVEVKFTGSPAPAGAQEVAVRNNQVPGEVVWFDRGEWAAFVAGVKNGEFDLE